MSKKKKVERVSIRKPKKTRVNKSRAVLFLFGRLKEIEHAVGYCELHKCYLEPKDVKEKRCNKKNCKYFKEQ